MLPTRRYLASIHSSTPPSCARATLLLCSRSLRLDFLSSPLNRLPDLALAGRGEFVLGRALARGGVPVGEHLQGEDEVQREAADEAVEDDFVGDLLHGREDASR
jgi:hypothetical protein